MLVRMQRKGNPRTLLVGMQTVQPLWKIVWRFLNKLKTELHYDPAIALLGIFPENSFRVAAPAVLMITVL